MLPGDPTWKKNFFFLVINLVNSPELPKFISCYVFDLIDEYLIRINYKRS